MQIEPRGPHGLRWFTLRGSSAIDGASWESPLLARFERLIVAHDVAMMRLSPRSAERASFQASARKRGTAIDEGARRLYPEEAGRAPLAELEAASDAVWIVHDGVIAKAPHDLADWGSTRARTRVSHAPTWTIWAHESAPRSRPTPPSSRRTHDPLATARALRHEDPARALASLEAALATDPRLVACWRLRGEILLERAEFDASIASFDRAIALGDDTATAKKSRALAEAALGRTRERPAPSLALIDRWRKRAAELRGSGDARAEIVDAALASLATPAASPSKRRRSPR